MRQNSAIPVVRNISHLLRKLGLKEKITQSPSMRAIISECRKHDVTDERTCRSRDEMLFTARAYDKYLESVSKYRELVAMYGKGEVSIEEAARKVGLKLPESKSIEER
ncbi:protein FMC1 homolog [Brevipalpus obovatus]|uniref:protein FMC1 homolog n=1 Tax=Brevipalpus obovatus TaxID=246614 RepID=UPI003D9E14BE